MEIKLELDTEKNRESHRGNRLRLRTRPRFRSLSIPPARCCQRTRADHYHYDPLRPPPGPHKIRLSRHASRRCHAPLQRGI